MNLQNLNLVELNAQEVQEVDGGNLVGSFLRGAAYVAQVAVLYFEGLEANFPGTAPAGSTMTSLANSTGSKL
ncbi:hypothetical protein [Flavobacterium hiemivividum]|uniref:hypothetical protein n=1 Tax=Flavobacterium hiemivividum TaxID=2541734 RepID=UPI001A9F4553|nr:hypothetical protein [Flavobacterium hiemivividum]